jgi:hypothetical protein
MLAVLIAGTTQDFFWVWNYFRSHPPSQISEYMEAGTISLIYATTGTLVWMLKTRSNQTARASDLAGSSGQHRYRPTCHAIRRKGQPGPSACK